MSPDDVTKPDAGKPDAGTSPDAGLPDAGGGGVDAGLPPGGGDAGLDAGVDAGVPATGDGCADPIPLKVVDGGAYVVGDTSGHADRGAGPCGGAGGQDVVYELQGPQSGDMVVTVAPLTSGGLQPVVYMSQLCDTPKYCIAAGTAGATTTLVGPSSSNGKYYLWVDGAPGTSGPYSITVTSSASIGEACGAPIELPFGSGEANVSATDTSWTDHTSGSCNSWSSSGDHVYRVTLDRVQNLEVRVSALSFVGDTYLRGVCGGGELVCNSSGLMRRQELAPGTYYLWRDSPRLTYELYAHLTDPIPGDSCATARPLVFSEGEDGGTATDTSTTVGTFDNGGSTCGSAGMPDVVYTFTTTKSFDFRASASGHSLSLRSATCTGTQLACVYGGIGGGHLPPGTYYLWVDSQSTTGAPFTLTASLTPSVPGDTCASPEPLVFSNGSLGGEAEARGNLSTRFHNSTGSCNSSSSSNDSVYSFTTSKTLNFRANAGSTAVYLRSGDCQSGPELSCGRWSGVEVTGLDAGTYHLWVDDDASSYTLWAALTPPPCEEPIPLVFKDGADGGGPTATFKGDTSAAFPTTQASCGGNGGRDAVHAFRLTEPRRLEATVTPLTYGFRPMLYLRASCDGEEQACTLAPAENSDATLSTGVLPAGSYYLWVDGYSGTVGAYNLSATLN
ncbi:hypothetical protein [Archangium sp.]|uniref:hypothetical protein n=1 Tax=Archangium sp. TaxID=1872627 RepID=UPI002ED79A28